MTAFDTLIEIVSRLRAPDGCPWDRVQTHESMRRNLVEETGEFIDAVEDDNDKEMKEELGDLLLQVVMHCQIASETNRFTIEQVIEAESAKLIYRHPHVFGENKAHSAQEALARWEESKSNDVELQAKRPSVMDGVPRSIPGLSRAQKAITKAAKQGFDWQDSTLAMKKVEEEFQEFTQAVSSGNKKNIEEELGDVFFALTAFCRKMDLEAEEVMHKAVKKFMNRFRAMENISKQQSVPMNQMSIEQLLELWDQAKKTNSKEL